MKLKATSIYIIFILTLFSCQNNNFTEILFRPMDDPFQDVPATDSLSKENAVFLNWEKDECCDVYILQRAVDAQILTFEKIYEGTNNSYCDNNLSENFRYIYRLDKKRGQKVFYGEKYAFGFCSSLRADSCEPNEEEQNAVILEHDLICNLPCVKFITENKTFIDEDWFFISLPPVRTAEIIISQAGLTNSTAGATTSLSLQVTGYSSQAVLQQTGILISNPSNETKTMYFKIYPNSSALFGADEFLTSLEYTISLNRIYKYEL